VIDMTYFAELVALHGERLRRRLTPVGVEKDLVRLWKQQHEAGILDERLPVNALDAVVCEMSLRYGRADIVVFHADGSASVIEAKDGAKGYTHVVSGIGQASLYATQISMTRSIRGVRRAILWSSTGDLALDAVIDATITDAGCLSLLWPSMQTLSAIELATRTVYAARDSAAASRG
jgi:hypothetical protein